MKLARLMIGLSFLACGPLPVVTQDVSFLVPLEQSRAFLSASTVLPRAQFDRLHALTIVDEPDALYGALSVVAVRLDACFREGVKPGPCQPQVRLVLQPVFDEAGTLTTRDAAVHLFFSTSEAQLLTLVKSMSTLRSERRLSPPDELAAPHPGFADAAFMTSLRTTLLPFLEARALVRITSMSVHASNLAWIFAGADLTNGQARDLHIPTLDALHEHHVTSTGREAALEVTIDPSSPMEPALTPVLAPGGLTRATPSELAAAATSVQRLEDPASHNPGTVDCAACHVAALAQRALAKQGVAVSGSPAASSAYDDTRNLRAFGYFFSVPAISPRVQRETALVREDFARRLEK
ncbi:MAG: hypothetical protein Q8L14_23385 [Myxococcales bacterium]|nr:hypothetical protein [Myxococcales bacterium]